MGTVEVATPGNFHAVPALAMKQAFQQLTDGKAVFGNPGVGCVGPYHITRMLLEVVKR